MHYANAAAVAAAHRGLLVLLGQLSRDRRHTRQPHRRPRQPSRQSRSRTMPGAIRTPDSRSAPAARGTIYVYGVDGVCHQLANQVLYATSGTRLTVNKARGYFFSTYLYGTYGLQHAAWASKIASCCGSHRGNAACRRSRRWWRARRRWRDLPADSRESEDARSKRRFRRARPGSPRPRRCLNCSPSCLP